MYDVVAVDELQAENDAGREEFCSARATALLFGEFAEAADVEAQVAAGEQVHDEVEVVSVLEGELHVDDEVVVVACEQSAFVENRVDRSLRDNPANRCLLSLRHLFECVVLLVVQEGHDPHLGQAALPSQSLLCR